MNQRWLCTAAHLDTIPPTNCQVRVSADIPPPTGQGLGGQPLNCFPVGPGPHVPLGSPRSRESTQGRSTVSSVYTLTHKPTDASAHAHSLDNSLRGVSCWKARVCALQREVPSICLHDEQCFSFLRYYEPEKSTKHKRNSTKGNTSNSAAFLCSPFSPIACCEVHTPQTLHGDTDRFLCTAAPWPRFGSTGT